MGRYEELFGIGEGEAFIGNEELPLPKYIAPIVKGATFGLIDDTPHYEYKELTPAIEEGYLPTPGGEVTIQDVPFKAVTTSDLIEAVAGELTGDLIAGGLGKLVGSLIRPLRRVIKQVIEEVERVPIKTLEGGYKVFKDPLPEGGSFYRIVSPDNKGAITARDSFSDIPDYLTVNTIGVDPAARGGKLGKNYKHDAYNAAVEWSHELGKKGIASAKQLRTSSITDRFWLDFGEGSIVDPSRNLTYDFLHTKTIPPLRPSEFKIVEAGVNPMVTSNKLMEEGAAGVIPLRRLVGKDRYGTLRPGQSDRIRAFAVLDEANITKRPLKEEGLVNITVKKGQAAEVTELIPKDVQDFSKTVKKDVGEGVATRIDKINSYDKWQFAQGDRIKSKSTGKVYKIVTRNWDVKNNRPMYRYIGLDSEEAGNFIAEKAHEGFDVLRGPR